VRPESGKNKNKTGGAQEKISYSGVGRNRAISPGSGFGPRSLSGPRDYRLLRLFGGGTTDMGTRLLSDMVSKSFGQPIVVVNKPGASHTLCANFMANSKPDGYTLGAFSASAVIQVPHLRKAPYNPMKGLTYVATYTDYTSGLVVNKDAPWKTMKEFMDYSKNNPGAMIYGSDGHGIATHILMEYLAWKWGAVDWKHVPIAGGPKLATAFLGGHIKAWAGPGSHVQFVKDGTMKLVLSLNIVRMPAAPDVPTVFELYLKEYRLGLRCSSPDPKASRSRF
jgi:tripartite-type tricarboxylate transporter receptor subunit TctC